MRKVTIGDIEEFSLERFNEHYRNLIDVGLSSGREQDMINTLSFITDFQILIEDLKTNMAAEPDECHLCNIKDEKIQTLQKSIDLLEEIKSVQKAKIEKLENLLEQTGNQDETKEMKVSE